MPTYFIVRATVSDPAKRAAFDKWYEQEHVPDAVKTFGAQKAWRFWSESDRSNAEYHRKRVSVAPGPGKVPLARGAAWLTLFRSRSPATLQKYAASRTLNARPDR